MTIENYGVGKRFEYDYHDVKIIDTYTGKTYNKDNFHLLVIDGLLNNLEDANKKLADENTNLFNILKNIRWLCDDCLKINKVYDAGYCVGITEIKKIVESYIEENSEIK